MPEHADEDRGEWTARQRTLVAAGLLLVGTLYAFPLSELDQFPFGPGPDGYLLFPFDPATDASMFTLIGLGKIGFGVAVLRSAKPLEAVALRRSFLVAGWLLVAWGTLGLAVTLFMGCLIGPAVPWTCPVGN